MNEKVIVLPSEAAQMLAAVIEDRLSEFAFVTYYENICIDKDNLAKIIQEHWDSMP